MVPTCRRVPFLQRAWLSLCRRSRHRNTTASPPAVVSVFYQRAGRSLRVCRFNAAIVLRAGFCADRNTRGKHPVGNSLGAVHHLRHLGFHITTTRDRQFSTAPNQVIYIFFMSSALLGTPCIFFIISILYVNSLFMIYSFV